MVWICWDCGFQSRRGNGCLSLLSSTCVWSGSGLWDELIPRLEESYRLWCLVLCDLKASRKKGSWPALSRSVKGMWVRRIIYQIAANIVQCLTELRSWKRCYLVELLNHSCIASRATEKTRWASRTYWANISVCYKIWAKVESHIRRCWSKIIVEYTYLVSTADSVCRLFFFIQHWI
jgi:hypothetical protein